MSLLFAGSQPSEIDPWTYLASNIAKSYSKG
jgi:hypothetical protein